MNRTHSLALTLALTAACSSSGGAVADGGVTSPDAATLSSSDAAPPTGDAAGLDARARPSDADGPSVDGGSPTKAGNPSGSCTAGLPALAQPASTSSPTTVVGTGAAASCTFAALESAVTKGGVITFDCGPSPTTILVTKTLDLPIDRDTVIDGGNLITLDGGGVVQILRWNSPNFQALDYRLTLQHLTLVNGKQTPTQAIPTAPAPCSQGWDDGEGGALFMRDGNLTVIDSIFKGNHAAPLGPDTGGGAIYVLGSKHGVVIASSTFTNNEASNAGAVGGLFAELDIYDSYFDGNSAVGHDANNNQPSLCSAMNNGQNETGSGGNGGAIYSDGNSVNIVLCGDLVTNNHAGTNAFGGGLFFTSDNMQGTLTITDTTMAGNTGGSWTNATSGVKNAGTAIGVNARSITVTNSTLQGAP